LPPTAPGNKWNYQKLMSMTASFSSSWTPFAESQLTVDDILCGRTLNLIQVKEQS
jgi:hypothetical protein